MPGEIDFVGSTSGFTKEEISLLGSDIRYNITIPIMDTSENNPKYQLGMDFYVYCSFICRPIPISVSKGAFENGPMRQSIRP
ncbi:MAG: hypothetical protein CM1200mP10_15900 [Candidatus Neomarinimicrobiota bacterium]|nr:MAG: hypothetical protein CM1200mP10_15900 [Candidatus Neomarinimicrobiota bacterium]